MFDYLFISLTDILIDNFIVFYLGYFGYLNQNNLFYFNPVFF